MFVAVDPQPTLYTQCVCTCPCTQLPPPSSTGSFVIATKQENQENFRTFSMWAPHILQNHNLDRTFFYCHAKAGLSCATVAPAPHNSRIRHVIFIECTKFNSMVLDCHQLTVTPSFVKIGQLPLWIMWGEQRQIRHGRNRLHAPFRRKVS